AAIRMAGQKISGAPATSWTWICCYVITIFGAWPVSHTRGAVRQIFGCVYARRTVRFAPVSALPGGVVCEAPPSLAPHALVGRTREAVRRMFGCVYARRTVRFAPVSALPGGVVCEPPPSLAPHALVGRTREAVLRMFGCVYARRT